MNNSYSAMRIFITLFFAMCLRIVPLSDTLAPLNPDWVLLVLIYWSLAIPESVGIAHAWFLGILVDVLLMLLCIFLCRKSAVFMIWNPSGQMPVIAGSCRCGF